MAEGGHLQVGGVVRHAARLRRHSVPPVNPACAARAHHCGLGTKHSEGSRGQMDTHGTLAHAVFDDKIGEHGLIGDGQPRRRRQTVGLMAGEGAFYHVDLGCLDIGEDVIASVLVALGKHLAFVENFEIELLTLAGAGGVRPIALLCVPARGKIHFLVQHGPDLGIELIEVRIVDPGSEEVEVHARHAARAERTLLDHRNIQAALCGIRRRRHTGIAATAHEHIGLIHLVGALGRHNRMPRFSQVGAIFLRGAPRRPQSRARQEGEAGRGADPLQERTSRTGSRIANEHAVVHCHSLSSLR